MSHGAIEQSSPYFAVESIELESIKLLVNDDSKKKALS